MAVAHDQYSCRILSQTVEPAQQSQNTPIAPCLTWQLPSWLLQKLTEHNITKAAHQHAELPRAQCAVCSIDAGLLVQLAAARAAATTWLQQPCPEAWEDRYGREPRKGADILVQVSAAQSPVKSNRADGVGAYTVQDTAASETEQLDV